VVDHAGTCIAVAVIGADHLVLVEPKCPGIAIDMDQKNQTWKSMDI
jgi:hypothetical protein